MASPQILSHSPLQTEEPGPSIIVQRLTPVSILNEQQMKIVADVGQATVPSVKGDALPATHTDHRLEKTDVKTTRLSEKELNALCELFYQGLLEEVIQSDFEKPSIPEVILAVITDLTNDDDKKPQDSDNNPSSAVYYFNQEQDQPPTATIASTSADIEQYYAHVRQSITETNGHDSMRSTKSSSSSIDVIPMDDRTEDEPPVRVDVLICRASKIIPILIFRIEQRVDERFEPPEYSLDPMASRRKSLRQRSSSRTMTINRD